MMRGVPLKKFVEPSGNFGIINSITKLHLVGISTEFYLGILRNFVQNLRKLDKKQKNIIRHFACRPKHIFMKISRQSSPLN